MTCPKCGWPNERGPFYRSDNYGGRLNFFCARCGAARSEQTLDQKKKNGTKFAEAPLPWEPKEETEIIVGYTTDHPDWLPKQAACGVLSDPEEPKE